MLVVGCEATPTDQADTASKADPGSTSTIWRAEPSKMRVYPSTRFVQEGDRSILEARLEMFDQMGDPIKASGTFLVELYSVDPSMGIAQGRLLFSWNAGTASLEQQREHYDPITRGYLFRLGVDNLRSAKDATLLKATFTPANGSQRLDAEAIIRPDW